MNAILAINYIIVQVEQDSSMPKFLPRFNEKLGMCLLILLLLSLLSTNSQMGLVFYLVSQIGIFNKGKFYFVMHFYIKLEK